MYISCISTSLFPVFPLRKTNWPHFRMTLFSPSGFAWTLVDSLKFCTAACGDNICIWIDLIGISSRSIFPPLLPPSPEKPFSLPADRCYWCVCLHLSSEFVPFLLPLLPPPSFVLQSFIHSSLMPIMTNGKRDREKYLPMQVLTKH